MYAEPVRGPSGPFWALVGYRITNQEAEAENPKLVFAGVTRATQLRVGGSGHILFG